MIDDPIIPKSIIDVLRRSLAHLQRSYDMANTVSGWWYLSGTTIAHYFVPGQHRTLCGATGKRGDYAGTQNQCPQCSTALNLRAASEELEPRR